MAKPKLKRVQPPGIHLADTKPERWTPPPPLKPLTRAQGLFLSSLRTNTLSIAVGSAGPGKTLLAAAFAADRLQAGDIDKIILTASGGPFRTRAVETLKDVTPDQACAHPNWVMGDRKSVV